MPDANGLANATTAAEQLRRLLLALPTLADDRAHPLSEIAERVGARPEVVLRDLTSLVTRVGDEPAGFTEGVSLLIGTDSVQFQTPGGHFRRPMALSREELHALDLGLAMLHHESPPDERGVVERARVRLQGAIGVVANVGNNSRHASLANESPVAQEIRRTLQECIRDRRVARITYRSATADSDDIRPVQPLGVVWSRGSWYLAAWCKKNEGLRVFRLDRIRAVDAESTRFTFAPEFSLELVLRDGKVLIGEEGAAMTVRYGPRIARWIAEREGQPLADDGSVTVELEAIQEEWAVRHVLRYGPDAEIVAPTALREAVAAALRQLIDE